MLCSVVGYMRYLIALFAIFLLLWHYVLPDNICGSSTCLLDTTDCKYIIVQQDAGVKKSPCISCSRRVKKSVRIEIWLLKHRRGDFLLHIINKFVEYIFYSVVMSIVYENRTYGAMGGWENSLYPILYIHKFQCYVFKNRQRKFGIRKSLRWYLLNILFCFDIITSGTNVDGYGG